MSSFPTQYQKTGRTLTLATKITNKLQVLPLNEKESILKVFCCC